MRVLVTGATGLIGFATVKELLAAGHEVTGLARTEASGKKLTEAGAQVALGSVDDLDSLRRAAASVDGAIHTAFYHKISHAPLGTLLRVFLGGAPGGIFMRFMKAAAAADRRAIETIAALLPGKGSPLVATFGTLGMKPGRLATEDDEYDHDFTSFGLGRARTEDTLKELVASRGIRTSAIRLPPIVHGPDAYGLAMLLIPAARKKKESAYVGDGLNRWPSVHYLDAARLFRLALENGPAGGTYHGVAEEGIPFRDIAGVIGRRLNVPVVSKPASEAAKQFGFIARPVQIDNPTSSKLTRERLGWTSTNMGLITDLEQTDFFSKV
ncbi:SDR family oxidoreductase [Bradyrhizobium prioriisuperbiae]|uniref:SDR family oxidoreductase n=1 Tax=Bradyrhizobium prioriisuperbiae TaxID=2854389 RepID=UPI0028E5A470|nr:SDR family oxidoreductase [Bradyrhizobium prioritasuperba]